METYSSFACKNKKKTILRRETILKCQLGYPVVYSSLIILNISVRYKKLTMSETHGNKIIEKGESS